MRATDIPVLLRSLWRKAYTKLQPTFNVNCCLTLLICYLLLYIKQYHLHYILIFNIATKCLDITYHVLLRYDILL